MNTLIYDIEIIKAIPNRSGPRDPKIEYCEGWHDHENMGVSVIGCYDYREDRYRVFCADNFGAFLSRCAIDGTLLVSFNGISFDNRVIDACLKTKIPERICYDLLVEVWAASGLGPKFAYPSHAGFGLDAICEANFGTKKTGNGAFAPVLWQRSQIGEVIDYCLNDVRLTKQLFDHVLDGGRLKCPKTGNPLTLRSPFALVAS